MTRTRNPRSPLIMRRLADSDGFALPSVIVIFSVVVIVSLTLAGAAVHAVGFSTSTRASTQSRAAADSGINDILATIGDTGAPLANRLPCSASHSYDASVAESDTVNYKTSYSATVHYYDAAGAELASCVGGFLQFDAVGDPPVKAVVDSTGTAIAKGVAGQSSGDTRSVTAVVALDVNTSYDNSAAIDKSVFSDASITLTNGATTIDPTGGTSADVYSNGDVSCTTGGTAHPIEGSIYAQGNVNLEHPCNVKGSVWSGTFTSTGNVEIGQNLMLYNQPNLTLAGAAVDGSLVTNGNIEIGHSVGNCSAASTGCGSVTSFGGTVTVDSGDSVAGDVQASGDVTLNSNSTAVYGNVRSTGGGLVSTASTTGTGHVVGGYVAVAGNQALSLSRIGEPASTCGASGNVTLKPCPGGTVGFDASQIPTALNYPTNTTVVAPQKESLPAIGSDTASLQPWLDAGWHLVTAPSCSTSDSTNSAAISALTGKSIVVFTNCGSSPLKLSDLNLHGDVVVMSQSGFDFGGNTTIDSANGVHQFYAIVPTDGKLPSSSTQTVTWQYPDGVDAYGNGYHSPVCNASRPAGYADITATNHFTTTDDVRSFFFTPCSWNVDNNAGPFNGEVYVGKSTTGNSPEVVYYEMDVPGALAYPTGPGVPITTVTATETSRFDTRG
ncbi:autotransporter outer membrane beta-barrel domain-containing protein [Gryllotalpicola ginsengisoli]|uniref:hypothetical protein n=1 Tax=Gryllotalpicola ginsengisoli TaxID=444608 RepID=UPI00040425F2|nr:hypothetical protein [Gryllotalpicola ginsengisoli]